MQSRYFDEGSLPVEQARQRLHDLLVHFRKDGLKLRNPQASALFSASAEVLAGLERAFEQYASSTAYGGWRR
jgi:hypothetical protein